ncbi:MAG: ABC transporter permease [Oscillospiraceae bacterium]|nr:ABC transporter permease [Oscillospiraceae bacterium]
MKMKYAAYPYIIWLIVFMAIPMGLIIYFALTDASGAFTIANIAQTGRYMPVLIRSIWLATISTAVCLVLAYPLSYMLSRMQGLTSRTLLTLVMLPMWMNFLLRTYAWMTLLEKNGIINQILGVFGIEPLTMINTQGAVIMGMVYNYIPFMILPLHSVMVKIGKDVIEAAQDLGASPASVFSQVILPLSMPGVRTGITMVFVPAVSTFVISQMLGGGTNQLIGDIIELQFLGNAYNPSLGSAISMVLMVLVLLCMSLTGFFDDDDVEDRLI